MSFAYVDTSVLVAIAFGERGGQRMARRLSAFSGLLASNLLEAELRAACAREDCTFADALLTDLKWVFPDRPLGPELGEVLAAGYVRGADLWHLACALYVTTAPADLSFLTLDGRQRLVARALGFQI
ncbi:MAG: PIN domain-containing protein [Acidobacteria bacterium]|nr:PIN domain-containing protein [Acidobacteriota bacterium]